MLKRLMSFPRVHDLYKLAMKCNLEMTEEQMDSLLYVMSTLYCIGHSEIEWLLLELPRLRREYAVVSLGLFGSYVRGEQRKGSDLDVLVEFSEIPGMLRFLEIS